jgi:hypothetical protein
VKITAVIIFNLLVLNALSQSALVKATEKSMRQVNDSLYAHETEVSNRMYTDFLAGIKECTEIQPCGGSYSPTATNGFT